MHMALVKTNGSPNKIKIMNVGKGLAGEAGDDEICEREIRMGE